jgi:hypothetical protein
MAIAAGCASAGGRGAPEVGQCGGDLLCPHWPGWIAAIADQPFQLYAYAFRWAGLEADPVNVRFGVSFSEARPPDHIYTLPDGFVRSGDRDHASARTTPHDTP